MNRLGTLILHIGLPKTGTTALQNWCAKARSRLLERNVIYPETNPGDYVPKHQFVIEELRSRSNQKVRCILEANKGKTIALSTEGLANQFWDLTQGQLAQFRSAVAAYRVKVFVVARDEAAWLKSYYKQCVINPPVTDYPYATTLDLAEFSQIDRVRFLCNLPHQGHLLSAAFGAEEVVCSRYEGEWFAEWCALLGCAADRAQLAATNESVKDDIIDFVLSVNRLGLRAEDRRLLLGLLQRGIASSHTVLRIYSDSIGSEPVAQAKLLAALEALALAGERSAEIAECVRAQFRLLSENGTAVE